VLLLVMMLLLQWTSTYLSVLLLQATLACMSVLLLKAEQDLSQCVSLTEYLHILL
jgi:hypothetical protein